MTCRKMTGYKTETLGLIVLPLTLGLLCSTAAQSEPGSDDAALAVPKANFVRADINKDSALDIDEFRAFVNANADADFGKSKKVRRFKAYERVFKKVDADNDGRLTWPEFTEAQQDRL